MEKLLTESLSRLLIPAADAPPCYIPLVAHRIRAGFPSPAEEYLDGALDLSEYLIRTAPRPSFFACAAIQ